MKQEKLENKLFYDNMDISNYCNSCLSETNVNIVSTKTRSILISLIDNTVTVENVVYLCTICCEKLKDYNEFRRMCVMNLKYIQQSCEQTKSVKLDEQTEIPVNNECTIDKYEISPEYKNQQSPVDFSSNETKVLKLPVRNMLIKQEKEVDLGELTENGLQNNIQNIDSEHDEILPPAKSIKRKSTNCGMKEELTISCPSIEVLVKQESEEFLNENNDSVSEMEKSSNGDFQGVHTFNSSDHTTTEGISWQRSPIGDRQDTGTSTDDATCNWSNNRTTVLSQPQFVTVQHIVEKRYKCKICHKSFTQSGHLSRHRRIHTEEKPFKCNACGKGFRQSTQLIVHKYIHTGEKPYKCSICNKSFADPSSLSKHKKTHSNEKPYHCTKCEKSFRDSHALRLHERRHNIDKLFKCKICEKNFRNRNILVRHQQSHDSDSPFKCDICQMVFTQEVNLSRHKRIHTGEKPYKCEICKKGFRDSSALNKHKVIHNPDKPFKCDECDKSFSMSEYLYIHQRLHTGENLHKCDVCKRGFNRLSNLIRHNRVHER